MAAAVVNDPAGSANTDISKGGTIALRAAPSMSSARTALRPPMNTPVRFAPRGPREKIARSEEHTSELQSPMRISSAVFCFKTKHQTPPVAKKIQTKSDQLEQD